MLKNEEMLKIFTAMVKIRLFEERIANLFREGKIPGWLHCYTGEEAVAVGTCVNLRPDDFITSTHRGHGHLIAKGARLDRMMAELYGKRTGYNKGKGGSMHIADLSIGVLGANGIVGGGIAIATGAGISIKLRGLDEVAVCFFGDGASNRGTFHEALNLAAVWKLPVIYVVENNFYGVSTAQQRVQAIKDISVRAIAYGMPGITVDGNDVLAVYDAVHKAVTSARNKKGPTLIECKTYRWRGHYEGDPQLYRTKEEVEKWKKRDPIVRFERELRARGLIDDGRVKKIRAQVIQEIESAIEFAEKSPYPEPAEALEDLFHDTRLEVDTSSEMIVPGTSVSVNQREYRRNGKAMREITYAEAVVEALREEMLRDATVYVIGEEVGIAPTFGATKGLLEEFGEGRVMDSPISETAIVGSSVGAAMTGTRPVAELMYATFLGVCMDEIYNQAAKMCYMTAGQARVPMVIRTPLLGSGGAAAQHSERPEAWCVHIPGLKVAIPSTPYDAKGLLKTAIRDDNPVLFFEHVFLYNKKGPVPEEEFIIPFGKAIIRKQGNDVTLIATSRMVHVSLNAAKILEKAGISVEIIDPRTLVPLDIPTIIGSVRKTGRLVIVTEESKSGSVAAEMSTLVIEKAFDYLDAPVKRVCAQDVPIPFSPPMEKFVLPSEDKIVKAVKEVCKNTSLNG